MSRECKAKNLYLREASTGLLRDTKTRAATGYGQSRHRVWDQ